MQKQWFIAVFVAALTLAGSWAAAQTPQTSPIAPSATDQTVPLKNPLNRNQAHRNRVPDTPPAPPDPRDSTIRPVMPPGNDGRDAVLSTPVATQPPASTPLTPAPGKHLPR